ncbi:MAG: DinB family protein [Planctomycetia bacterium]|nr:DinB family protein [Planctomycetia bacterium]
MNGVAAIRGALQSTQHILGMYLNDLSDADLLIRPVAGANHIAWQLGHLIVAEGKLLDVLPGIRFPDLPAGFEALHDQKGANDEPNAAYLKKSEYLDLFNRSRAVSLAALDTMTDADLDKPNPGPMAKFAPTLGALLLLVSNHTLMHAGQFTVVRRKLGKPVVI